MLFCAVHRRQEGRSWLWLPRQPEPYERGWRNGMTVTPRVIPDSLSVSLWLLKAPRCRRPGGTQEAFLAFAQVGLLPVEYPGQRACLHFLMSCIPAWPRASPAKRPSCFRPTPACPAWPSLSLACLLHTSPCDLSFLLSVVVCLPTCPTYLSSRQPYRPLPACLLNQSCLLLYLLNCRACSSLQPT